MNTRILILGSNGQIGTVLAESLRTKYGRDQVICSDVREPKLKTDGPFRLIDVLDSKAIEQVIQEENINQVYHLAALLSARGEQNPTLTWQINMQGLLNVLDICSRLNVSRLFFQALSRFMDQPHPNSLHLNLQVYNPQRYMVSVNWLVKCGANIITIAMGLMFVH